MNFKMENMLICLFLSFISIQGYPVKMGGTENNIEFKDEKRYPNGTVIGKYTYKDKDGNPVNVKYFADDASYGVELQSVKVIDNSSELRQGKLPELDNMMSTSVLQPLEAMSTVGAILNRQFNNNNNNNSYNPFEILNNYPIPKASGNKGLLNTNNDYEIFLENDLKPLSKCTKDKVKVYMDKNKRKSRNTAYHYNPSAYCERL